MGMGAAKPGSTLPPQGGKGGVQRPNRPGQPQVPFQGKGQPGQPQVQPPYTPIGYPPVQPQVPAQGGKAPLPTGVGDVFPTPRVQQPISSGMSPDLAAKYAEMERMRAGQVPGQVPAQGGKAPLTQEQIDAFKPNISPARPQVFPAQPQVQQLAPGQVAPTQAEIDRLRPMLTSPMRPQVMPAQPRPANMAPQGLAQLQQMLAGRR
jgi:hypothetical protein